MTPKERITLAIHCMIRFATTIEEINSIYPIFSRILKIWDERYCPKAIKLSGRNPQKAFWE